MSLKIESSYQSNNPQAVKTDTQTKKKDSVFNAVETKQPLSKKTQAATERYKAIQNKTLVYHKQEVRDNYFLWIFKTGTEIVPAYYEYTADGKEFIIQIRNKFGIKEGAIGKFNPYYNTPDADGCIPSAGTKIRFYEYDVE